MARALTVALFVALVLGTGLPCPAHAQEQAKPQAAVAAPSGTPIPADAVVMIWRCAVKPGHDTAQRKAAAATSRGVANVPGSATFLAMNSMSGPQESWFVAPYLSLAEMDKARAEGTKAPAAQAEVDRLNDLEGVHYDWWRGILAKYRQDLSLDASFNVSAYRAMEVTTYRVKLGRERQFVEMAQKVLAAYRKAYPNLRLAAFEVIQGGPLDTFLFMRPLKAAVDLLPPESARKAYLEALGPETIEQFDKGIGDVVTSVESQVFMFSPEMSYVPASYAAADPFWRVKAPALAKAELKKEGEAQKKAVEPTKKVMEPVKK